MFLKNNRKHNFEMLLTQTKGKLIKQIKFQLENINNHYI